MWPSGTEALLRRRHASNGHDQAQPSWHRRLKQPMVAKIRLQYPSSLMAGLKMKTYRKAGFNLVLGPMFSIPGA